MSNNNEELKAMPRIGTSPILTQEQLIRRVESIAFDVYDIRQQQQLDKNPNWWKFADMLDDVLDILDVLSKPK